MIEHATEENTDMSILQKWNYMLYGSVQNPVIKDCLGTFPRTVLF